MVDAVDVANDGVDFFLAIALQRHALRNVQLGTFYCEDCTELIPSARREAVEGCTTCVDCQELRERYR